jgi:hypothetical protein
MEIYKGDTLSGYAITVSDDGCEMTIYEKDATFSDGNGEIIVEGLPEYIIEELSDAEAFQFFTFAKTYFDNLKQYMNQMDDE